MAGKVEKYWAKRAKSISNLLLKMNKKIAESLDFKRKNAILNTTRVAVVSLSLPVKINDSNTRKNTF